MEIKEYLQQLKIDKNKDILISLVINILNTEEVLIDTHTNFNVALKALLDSAFSYVKVHKIEISSELTDLDLDYWKNNIKLYQSKVPNMTTDVFLYSIRNSLKCLLEITKDKKLQKAYIFEIIISVFLFIDFLNLSIDVILSK